MIIHNQHGYHQFSDFIDFMQGIVLSCILCVHKGAVKAPDETVRGKHYLSVFMGFVRTGSFVGIDQVLVIVNGHTPIVPE